MLSESELQRLAAAARSFPPASTAYVDDDFVTCLISTVVDFMTRTTAVERALAYFQRHRGADFVTLGDLQAFLARYPDDRAGNEAAALALVGYRMWTRIGLLRSLVAYLDDQRIDDIVALRAWATASDFRRDFEGRVRYVGDGIVYGLGPAVYNWLVMRLGVETVKPDVRLRRFVERAVGRGVTDSEIVEGVTEAARWLGTTPRQLDWAIWESGGR